MEQRNPKAYIGHLLAFGTILISSFNTNFMKVVLGGHWIESEGLVVLRAFVATVGFWLIGLFLREDPAKKPTRREKLMFMLGGVLGMGFNLLLYIRGLSLTGPIDALVIRTSQPIVVIALAALFFRRKFTRYKIWGIVLGIVGTVYVSVTPHHGAVSDSFGGDALVFLSSVSMALFLILIQPYTEKFNTFVVMKWMSLAMLIVSLPFGWKEFIQARLLHEAAPLHIYLELSFTAVMAGMVSYFMTVSSLKFISPFLESSYIYVLPILGAVVSILMGLQKFSWHDPIALVLIVAGFILINKTEKVSHPSTMFHS